MSFLQLPVTLQCGYKELDLFTGNHLITCKLESTYLKP